ncbi:hypothetical protein F5X99DRAFT_363048 [Biscogniauxia marginata]|nr:hypothetical protein F5X99DRAFT_363048 [Biscogniauxia marginata]
MAEFGRAIQAALRSTVPLRSSPLRWQPCHNLTTASMASAGRPLASSPSLRAARATNGTIDRQQPYSTSYWGGRIRPTPPSRDEDKDIKKPNIDSYNESSTANSSGDFDVVDNNTDFAAGIDLELRDIDNSLSRQEPQDSTIPPGPTMRLVSRTGRTIQTGRNVDVARAFKMLAVQVASNRLRRDFQHQKFHERPGLKRKRLKSERWRRRFKKGFKAAVDRVGELTRQGW